MPVNQFWSECEINIGKYVKYKLDCISNISSFVVCLGLNFYYQLQKQRFNQRGLWIEKWSKDTRLSIFRSPAQKLGRMYNKFFSNWFVVVVAMPFENWLSERHKFSSYLDHRRINRFESKYIYRLIGVLQMKWISISN